MGTGILAAIASLAAPMAMRVLIALGISVLTLGGITAALASLKSSILDAFSGASVAVLQLIGLGGGWVALGMLFGAMTFAATLWALTKATRLAFV